MLPLAINSLISWDGSIPSSLPVSAFSDGKSGNSAISPFTSEVDILRTPDDLESFSEMPGWRDLRSSLGFPHRWICFEHTIGTDVPGSPVLGLPQRSLGVSRDCCSHSCSAPEAA